MKSFELPNQHELSRLSYPSELRPDGLADTYVDTEGNTYLDPVARHDFVASERLAAKRVSSGKVVTREGRSMIRYSKNTDLVLVSSLLNSADGNEGTLSDVDQALALTNSHLINMRRKCGILPNSLTLDMLAIDRANGHAELLAPFSIVEDAGGAYIDELMDDLELDVLSRSVGDQQRVMISDSFSKFRREQGRL